MWHFLSVLIGMKVVSRPGIDSGLNFLLAVCRLDVILHLHLRVCAHRRVSVWQELSLFDNEPVLCVSPNTAQGERLSLWWKAYLRVIRYKEAQLFIRPPAGFCLLACIWLYVRVCAYMPPSVVTLWALTSEWHQASGHSDSVCSSTSTGTSISSN